MERVFILDPHVGAVYFRRRGLKRDNGSDLVSLPRSTFKQLAISPGHHEFRFKPFPQGSRMATLDAIAGKTYYLIVGYSPGKSWAFPIAGDPMLIKIGSDEEAREAMKEMQER